VGIRFSRIVRGNLIDDKALTVFENFNIRRYYDEEKEKWYFSVVDVAHALTGSKNPTDYLKKLRKHDVELGGYIGTNCPHVEMVVNGKKRKTLAGDVDVKDMSRIIQSIPSPKAEPIKRCLAKVGYECIEEVSDPEKSINRDRENWKKHGRSDKWLQRRMMGQETRNKLTDYWKSHGVKEGNEFAVLTNIIHKEWSDLSVMNIKN
jgi:hypothetical protein